jgi:potassium channel
MINGGRADAQGNTALWNAIAARHHKTFNILYHFAHVSAPHAGGDLLCLATRRDDLDTLRELLKHGMDVDAEDHDGATALRVALSEGRADAARFLIMNGASVDKATLHDAGGGAALLPAEMRELLQRRELGHQITIHDRPKAVVRDGGSSGNGRHGRSLGTTKPDSLRVSIYKGHPFLRNHSSEAGKLINLPVTMQEFKGAIGKRRSGTIHFCCDNVVIVV